VKTVALLLLVAVAANAAENAGEAAFQRRCAGCHELNRDKAGPRLGEAFGRKAASVTGFEYSDALKKSGITWDEATLGKWIADPESVVPDNDMPFRLEDAKEREAIIRYLKEVAKRK
jgi:cytochrome c